MKALISIFLYLSHLLCCSLAVPIELYGINYNTRKGADWNPLKCKDYDEIFRDLTMLRRITSRVRILSLTDCGQGEMVLTAAKEVGLKVWLGIWLGVDGDVFDLEVEFLRDFLSRGLIDDNVLGISVGSEAILRADVSVAMNIDMMQEVKNVFVENDMPDFPVGICDIAPTYQRYLRRLVDPIDVVVVNSFPFWESVDLSDSTAYLLREIDPIEQRASAQGKEIIIGETGWPSDGFLPGVALASERNQREFFVRFFCHLDKYTGWKYYWFTGIDNAWRQEQDPKNTIEGNWGIMYANLTVKPQFADLTFVCPHDATTRYNLNETDWTVPALPSRAPNPASCQAHSACASLLGNCCPTDGGLLLDCCSATTDVSATFDDITTTPASLAPTVGPSNTSSPTGSPIGDDEELADSQTLGPTATPTAQATTDTPTTQETTDTPTTQETTNTPTAAPTAELTVMVTVEPTDAPALQETDMPTTVQPTVESTIASDTLQSTSDEPSTSPSEAQATETPSVAETSMPTKVDPSLSAVKTSGSYQRQEFWSMPVFLSAFMYWAIMS